jgi:arsenate reductase
MADECKWKNDMAENTPPQPYKVLFLCTGNSARSIMAECILNRLGKGGFQAYSAGSAPKGAVNPHAIELLQKLGYANTATLRSKSWDEFARPDALKIDFVITVCDKAAGETCPVWPRHPLRAHWGIPDPAAVKGPEDRIMQAFVAAYQQLSARIALFLEIPFAEMAASALKQRVDAINQILDTSPPQNDL